MGKQPTGNPALAEVMRRHREQTGLSQNALAKMANVHASTIWKIEASKRSIGLTALTKMTALLGQGFREEAEAAMKYGH